ncbi:50S ribosomal protein L29 [Candidatus Falkowbacteria bacterium HGW-Falkowbacteria-1]|uniref:Large ribosomal subunit protein uL29 n=1 Tax=Candidatus Falkowbacteria bacterium HGW-Falkowbacteria-1 TaxID=2013768 RepID=A0A2N2E9B4_9BACT|nr:MAG: 50S ribosomal protein L29 [Candidatus Falkowbacteria bacterium HGW-Falkowbacteria-1]
MDFKELKNKKKSELHALLAKWREELRAFRFKNSNSQLKNIREMRSVRKNIARILTLLNGGKEEKVENIKNQEENK